MGTSDFYVDMRQANAAVMPEKHQIPTIEVIYDMSQSKVFTKLDIKWVYLPLLIDEESRMITFTTHKGLFRYKRLLFGLKSANEHYQKVIQ